MRRIADSKGTTPHIAARHVVAVTGHFLTVCAVDIATVFACHYKQLRCQIFQMLLRILVLHHLLRHRRSQLCLSSTSPHLAVVNMTLHSACPQPAVLAPCALAQSPKCAGTYPAPPESPRRIAFPKCITPHSYVCCCQTEPHNQYWWSQLTAAAAQRSAAAQPGRQFGVA
jgi:hypothetical protein